MTSDPKDFLEGDTVRDRLTNLEGKVTKVGRKWVHADIDNKVQAYDPQRLKVIRSSPLFYRLSLRKQDL